MKTCNIFIVRQVTYLEVFIEKHISNGQIIVLGAADWGDLEQTGKMKVGQLLILHLIVDL